MSCEIAGYVTEEAARATDLAAGTPVATGLHEVTACAIGAGVMKAGTIAIIAGTYSINEMLVDVPKTSAGWNARNGLQQGQWMNMSVSPASSANLDWFLRTAARDALADGNPFAVLQAELDAVAQDPSDIVYLPYLYGSPHIEDVPAVFSGCAVGMNVAICCYQPGQAVCGLQAGYDRYCDTIDTVMHRFKEKTAL